MVTRILYAIISIFLVKILKNPNLYLKILTTYYKNPIQVFLTLNVLKINIFIKFIVFTWNIFNFLTFWFLWADKW